MIEVGVQEGIFSEYIMQRTQPSQLVLIDCWEKQPQHVYNDIANVSNQEQIRKFKRVCSKFSHLSQIKTIKNFSTPASYQFTDNSVDWIYLDANHSYAAVKEDIKNWWPKIKKGGFLTGHDYVLQDNFGVVQAVNEFLEDNNLQMHMLTTKDHYNSWCIQKPLD